MRFLVIELILFLLVAPLSAESESVAFPKESLQDEQHYGDYTVRIYRESITNSLFQILKDDLVLYSEEGRRFQIGDICRDNKNPLIEMGKDITGDGEPNLVVSHWSGGAHCCFTYY